MCLFHFSTCFEQPSAHHQENQLYHIIWYISLRVGGRLVCRSLTCIPDSHLHGVIYVYQMMYWYNCFSWWWALGCSKHVEKWNKHIKKCVSLVINTNCTEMHGQQNIKFSVLRVSTKYIVFLWRSSLCIVKQIRLNAVLRWNHTSLTCLSLKILEQSTLPYIHNDFKTRF